MNGALWGIWKEIGGIFQDTTYFNLERLQKIMKNLNLDS